MHGARYSAFLQRDIDFVNARAAWTTDQKDVFDHLLKGRLNDIGIMKELHIGDRKFYRVKREIDRKIAVILQENDR